MQTTHKYIREFHVFFNFLTKTLEKEIIQSSDADEDDNFNSYISSRTFGKINIAVKQ